MRLFAVYTFMIANVVGQGIVATDCVWNVDGNYNLDLSYYVKNSIFIEASNWQYQYSYSPCNRSFSGTYLGNAWVWAIERRDINNFSNVAYMLSSGFSWVDPIIAPQSILTFEFDYDDINTSCPNNQQLTTIYWQCNNTINNHPYYYDIISCGSLYECSNTLFIQSPFACQYNRPSNLNYPCIFTTNIHRQPYTLNLSKFQENEISNWNGSTSSEQTFWYYPCINTRKSKNNALTTPWSMVRAVLNNFWYVYEIWNISDITQPTYNVFENVWSFVYYGYSKYCDDFVATINWNCSCQYEQPYYTELLLLDNDCHAIFNVSTNDLCIPGECTQNDSDCVYYYETEPNEYVMLNLTALKGSNIEFTEQGGITYFLYTPCNNNIMCNGMETMAVRKDLNNGDCMDLATFNGIYDYKKHYEKYDWTISYSNGDQCNQDNIQFIVNWKCQSGIEWRIDNESLVTQCIYSATIYSKYACT